MTPAEVLAALGEPQALDAVSPLWSDSLAAQPAAGLPILEPAAIGHSRELAEFGSEVEPVLLRVAARIQAHRPLRRLAWHCAWDEVVLDWVAGGVPGLGRDERSRRAGPLPAARVGLVPRRAFHKGSRLTSP